jgi:hypothetical protein
VTRSHEYSDALRYGVEATGEYRLADRDSQLRFRILGPASGQTVEYRACFWQLEVKGRDKLRPDRPIELFPLQSGETLGSAEVLKRRLLSKVEMRGSVASPLVVYEPVEFVSAAVVEREP